MSNKEKRADRSDFYIIGAFIDKLPVWMYSDNRYFWQEVRRKLEGHAITDLAQAIFDANEKAEITPKVSKIRCYENYNTGYLLGWYLREELRKSCRQYPIDIDPRKFGYEFPDKNQNKFTLVMTSDILRLTYRRRYIVDNFIYSFTENRNDQLNPFLFTAILTKRNVLHNNLPIVLSLLTGILKAINIIQNIKANEENLKDPNLEKIRKSLKKYNQESYIFEVYKYNKYEQRKYIAKSIQSIKHIYAIKDGQYLTVQEVSTAYNNAKYLWEKLLQKKLLGQPKWLKQLPNTEKLNEPLPSLLIQKNWQVNNKITQYLLCRLWKRWIVDRFFTYHEDTVKNIFFSFVIVFYIALSLFTIYSIFLLSITNIIVKYFLVIIFVIFLLIKILYSCLYIQDYQRNRSSNNYKNLREVVTSLITGSIGYFCAIELGFMLSLLQYFVSETQ